MSNRCPSCGRDNKATARFCAGCGEGNLQQLAQSLSPLSYIPPDPQQMVELTPQLPAAKLAETRMSSEPTPLKHFADPAITRTAPTRRGRLFERPPLAAGEIDRLKEQSVPPPTDFTLVAVRIAVVLAVLPLLLSLFASVGLVVMVILFLGGGVVLMVFAGLAGALGKLLSLLLPRRRAVGRDTTVVRFVVCDPNGDEHAVEVYGDRVGGKLHKGDVVEVFGQRTRDGDIRAGRVVVVGGVHAVGAIARRRVRGTQPLHWALALLAWLLTTAVWYYLYLTVITPVFQP
jgi:hypothetical protein